MLNYALEVSGQDQLSYVGHSQGTAMGLGGFSSMPELVAKIKLFVALARPVANTTTGYRGAVRVVTNQLLLKETVWRQFISNHHHSMIF